MTHFKRPLKAAAIASVIALTTAAAAPSAFAADGAYAKVSERAVQKMKNNRGDRNVNRNRGTRSDRGDRGNRRGDHSTRRSDRRDNYRSDRRRDNYRNDRRRDYVHLRTPRRSSYNTGYRRGLDFGLHRTNYNPRRRGHGYRHNGFSSGYRSGLGISFSFGSPGYSSYRWAPSNYGFYRPGRVSYASYRNRTRCDRVIVDGLHYGTIRPVSVTQCYNPWDGYYIVQGTERIAYNAW